MPSDQFKMHVPVTNFELTPSQTLLALFADYAILLLYTHSIADITAELLIIYSFVNKVNQQDERVNTAFNSMQNDPVILSSCQPAEKCNNSYFPREK